MRPGVIPRELTSLIACVVLLAAGCAEASTTTGVSSSVVVTSDPTATTATTTATTIVPTTLEGHRTATKLVLVGDSLASEASVYFPTLLGSTVFVPYPFGGTAACDWFDLDMGGSPSTVVVISFHGNTSTPCAQPPSGAPATVGWIVARYREDVSHLIDTAMAAGSVVVLVGQPENGPSDWPPGLESKLNAMYQQLAAERGIDYIDAGAAVESPAGLFTRRLPCLPEEPVCDDDGTITVRSDDGVHFCPTKMEGYECPVYSSGAYRYAKAIAALATVI